MSRPRAAAMTGGSSRGCDKNVNPLPVHSNFPYFRGADISSSDWQIEGLCCLSLRFHTICPKYFRCCLAHTGGGKPGHSDAGR